MYKALIAYTFENMKMNPVQLKAGTENVEVELWLKGWVSNSEGIERDGGVHSRGYIDLAGL